MASFYPSDYLEDETDYNSGFAFSDYITLNAIPEKEEPEEDSSISSAWCGGITVMTIIILIVIIIMYQKKRKEKSTSGKKLDKKDTTIPYALKQKGTNLRGFTIFFIIWFCFWGIIWGIFAISDVVKENENIGGMIFVWIFAQIIFSGPFYIIQVIWTRRYKKRVERSGSPSVPKELPKKVKPVPKLKPKPTPQYSSPKPVSPSQAPVKIPQYQPSPLPIQPITTPTPSTPSEETRLCMACGQHISLKYLVCPYCQTRVGTVQPKPQPMICPLPPRTTQQIQAKQPIIPPTPLMQSPVFNKPDEIQPQPSHPVIQVQTSSQEPSVSKKKPEQQKICIGVFIVFVILIIGFVVYAYLPDDEEETYIGFGEPAYVGASSDNYHMWCVDVYPETNINEIETQSKTSGCLVQYIGSNVITLAHPVVYGQYVYDISFTIDFISEGEEYSQDYTLKCRVS